MRGGILYARTNEKTAMLYRPAGPCVSGQRSTTRNIPILYGNSPKKTLEGNVLQGPGLYVSGSETEVGLVLEIILYL